MEGELVRLPGLTMEALLEIRDRCAPGVDVKSTDTPGAYWFNGDPSERSDLKGEAAIHVSGIAAVYSS